MRLRFTSVSEAVSDATNTWKMVAAKLVISFRTQSEPRCSRYSAPFENTCFCSGQILDTFHPSDHLKDLLQTTVLAQNVALELSESFPQRFHAPFRFFPEPPPALFSHRIGLQPSLRVERFGLCERGRAGEEERPENRRIEEVWVRHDVEQIRSDRQPVLLP